MIRKVALYSLIMVAVAGAWWLHKDARRLEPGNVLAALMLLPVFAWLIWLRWDWAPEEWRRKQRARNNKGGATTERDASQHVTDAAERP